MVETFPIIPGQIRVMWILVPVLLVVATTFCALAFSLSGSRNARFEVSPEGFRLRGDFYGRLIQHDALALADAHATNLRTDTRLKPVSRRGGTAVGGYQSGWFRLADGEKALLYVTDPTSVAYIPTTKGYSLLLSVADPDGLISSLKRAAGGR